MPRKLLKILGINPGTRYFGIAVFQGPELKDWGIKVVKGRWSKEKMRRVMKIVSRLTEQYEPKVLAIKKLHPSRSSNNLKSLVRKIKELARRKKLKVYQYSIEELEAFFSPGEKTNKKGLAELVASAYPELLNELKKEKTSKNSYHLRMFEAVALGSMCFHQLDK
jgi:Holliday junction resolvasome RuvABC endonuclease subunit